jgi:sulfur-oxidizing protein SoxZ
MSALARVQLPPSAKRGELVEIQLIIQHPMETGFRYDALGRRTPRNPIHTLVCRYAGREIFRAAMSTGFAANPLLRFYTRAVETGNIDFTWVDEASVQGGTTARLQVLD